MMKCVRPSRTTPTWPTIPQLYVKGEFIGGSDIMAEMAGNGELKKLFDEQAA